MIKMTMSADIEIIEVDWSRSQAELCLIRRAVFIEEQQVSEALEWDGIDGDCRHLLAHDISTDLSRAIVVGTGRLVPDGQIGRMAIRKEYRRMGVGFKILQQLIRFAQQEAKDEIYLHAQLYVVEFYQKAGFEVSGDIFMDAGIPHIKMSKRL